MPRGPTQCGSRLCLSDRPQYSVVRAQIKADNLFFKAMHLFFLERLSQQNKTLFRLATDQCFFTDEADINTNTNREIKKKTKNRYIEKLSFKFNLNPIMSAILSLERLGISVQSVEAYH